MKTAIDLERLPSHVAIMMDGNGRWAKKRFLNRLAGHRAGAQALKKLTTEANKLGLKYMTVYAFSTENWTRSDDEVKGLMDLIRQYVQEYIDSKDKDNIRIRIIGDIGRLDNDIREKINFLESTTRDKTGLCLILALNYGGRDEVVRASKKIISDVLKGNITVKDIDEASFSTYLDTAEFPEPELLIRTSGEKRLSNFLLWEISYTELYFTDVYWPDFKISHLKEAICDYQSRDRRFGGRGE